VTERRARVLAVEDAPDIRMLVEITLKRAGFDVRSEADGSSLDEAVEAFRPDIAVLDVWLPNGPNGFDLARRLRQTTDIPILFLTAADSLEHRLEGFESGGSDYLPKPFAPEELAARVKALLNLSGRLSEKVWQIGDVVIDETSRSVIRAGPPLELTRTEFDLLVALARKPGRFFSKTELLNEVWGYDAYDTHLVEVHISSLRRKLEEQGSRLIHTVRGVGYVVRP
jgi:two-component system, OmpR family, response regulator